MHEIYRMKVIWFLKLSRNGKEDRERLQNCSGLKKNKEICQLNMMCDLGLDSEPEMKKKHLGKSW